MPKLNDTQLVILANAAKRADRCQSAFNFDP